jgi:muramoyltetrapeptide carboxypeptidase
MGTNLAPKFSGKILFLEEVGEPFYKIDRMIHQLKLAGITNGLKAVVLGQFTDCKDLGFPLPLNEIFKSVFTGTPIFSGLQSGHAEPNFPLILGEMATIRKQGNNILLEQVLKTKQLL